jgi:hypothetical protein
VLQGNELIDSQLELKFRTDLPKTDICTVTLDDDKVCGRAGGHPPVGGSALGAGGGVSWVGVCPRAARLLVGRKARCPCRTRLRAGAV